MRFLYYLSQVFLNTFQMTKVFLKMRYQNIIQFSRNSPATENAVLFPLVHIDLQHEFLNRNTVDSY